MLNHSTLISIHRKKGAVWTFNLRWEGRGGRLCRVLRPSHSYALLLTPQGFLFNVSLWGGVSIMVRLVLKVYTRFAGDYKL